MWYTPKVGKIEGYGIRSTSRQALAVIKEYREAIEDDNYLLASKIRAANPDLKADFDKIWPKLVKGWRNLP